MQVEEQELAICSGRRSINKNTTFKSKEECIAKTKDRKEKKDPMKAEPQKKKEKEEGKKKSS